MFTERFEPPHSLSMSKKKLEPIANINIWSYIFYKTVLCYVQGAQKKLDTASFIEQDQRFRIHIMFLNLVEKSILYLLFYCVFFALSYVQGALVMNL